jgi:hypothetical protein
MPARKNYEICKCLLCIEKNGFDDKGLPIGNRILRSQLNDHLALSDAILLDCRAADAAADVYRSTLGSEFFLSTLQDDDGNEARIARSLSSHSYFPEVMSQPSESFPSLSSLAEALPSIPSVPESFSFPNKDCSRQDERHRQEKKERHRATLKAHLAFDQLEREIAEIYMFLDEGLLPNGLFSVLEERLVKAYLCFEAISRSTPSLEERRTKIKERLENLDDQLSELRLSIQDRDLTPKPYDTGVLAPVQKSQYVI